MCSCRLNMWRCTLMRVMLLVTVCSVTSFSEPSKRAYGEACSVDSDCEDVFTCSSERKCACPYGQVMPSDAQTCYDAVLYGDACEYTEQCRAHLPNSVCNDTCQCDDGFHYVDIDDHSCVPGVKKYGHECYSFFYCEKPFNNCTSHGCDCPANFTVSEDKLKCVAGSGLLTAEAKIVLLTCLSSLLLSEVTFDKK